MMFKTLRAKALHIRLLRNGALRISPLRTGALLIILATLTACSILPDNEPATLYRLPAVDTSGQPNAAATHAMTLGIATPETGHLLGSNRMVVFPEGNVVNVYEGARWHEDAPDMLKARLIEGLQAQQRFASVGSDRLPHDLTLLSELRHFQSEYDDTPPSVNVQLDVQLVDSNRAPLATSSFAIRKRASSVAIADVVDAFGAASDDLNQQLGEWLTREVTR
ncbi:ABC-type transport auxiliary lipoprotein family protein [Halomonas sp. C22]|uniref:ABC-type transport auxiliary lipoprotein family protein n=1 Tax=Halomonas sp. C22 TaxID=2580567 RepID=UPI0011AAA94B|nr:ABC-type transport auxiliary lipoprotein family protein [Halomonas sp. C22]